MVHFVFNLLLIFAKLAFFLVNGDPMDISLTQKIDHEGFHREISWLLESNLNSKCKMLIRFPIGRGFFLNPDEIIDLRRKQGLMIYIENQVDVEVPLHHAEENVAYIFPPNRSEKISINFPFHLRYQRALISGGYGKVVVNKPSILTICPEPHGETNVEAPCDVQATKKCIWKNSTYQALFDEVELLVPVGDLDEYPLISIVSLLLGCAGCIYTLSILSTTPL